MARERNGTSSDRAKKRPKDKLEILIAERNRVQARLEQEQEQLETLRFIVDDLAHRVAHDERMLRELNSLLGAEPQLRLEEADLRLRGRRLEEVAIQILRDEVDDDAVVHYRNWFGLVCAHGYAVAGKEPLNTFLSQINRSDGVERVGQRTGLYRLSRAS